VARRKKQKAPLTWKLLGTGMAVPAGIAVRKLSDTAWYAVRGTQPPKNPAAPGKVTKTSSTNRLARRLVLPGTLFCSWRKVGIFRAFAARTAGALA